MDVDIPTADANARRTWSPHRDDAGDAGFGIYIHWPFCASKCPYCDFNSHVRHAPIDEAAFLAAYVRELETLCMRVAREPITSIFFGGGTPSLMSPATVGAILEAIADNFELARSVEVTLEANPTSVEAARFAGYRTAGINRVSIGVQALNDHDLKVLGRRHSVAEANAALEIALAIFERVSFDLIYARPGQSTGQWSEELSEALARAPGHLSLYQLTIEPGTPFAALHASGRLKIPDPDRAADLYDVTSELTGKAGLQAYEVSNYAVPGQESRHNLCYWRYGQYLGIGPGAHGRLRLHEGRGRLATSTERHPETWRMRVAQDGHGIVSEDPLTSREMADEMLIMALRLSEGISLERLGCLTGFGPNPEQLQELVGDGLLAVNGDRISATDGGRLVLNSLAAQLSESLHARA